MGVRCPSHSVRQLGDQLALHVSDTTLPLSTLGSLGAFGTLSFTHDTGRAGVPDPVRKYVFMTPMRARLNRPKPLVGWFATADPCDNALWRLQ